MKSFVLGVFTFVLFGIALAPLGAVDFDVATAAQLHAALESAHDNGADDLIKLRKGTYHGQFKYESYEGKNLTIVGGYSSNSDPVIDPASTILDGEAGGTVLYCLTSGGVEVKGITIQNGKSDRGAGGVWLYHVRTKKSPLAGEIRLSNTVIRDNASLKCGGGVGIGAEAKPDTGGRAYDVVLVDNVIARNRSAEHGGGVNIFVFSSPPVDVAGRILLDGNTVSDNAATNWGGGVAIESKTSDGKAMDIRLLNNNATSNHVSPGYSDACFPYGGGGVWIRTRSQGGSAGTISLQGNTISQNRTTSWGGGVFVESMSESGASAPIVFVNNMMSGNRAEAGSGGGLFACTYAGLLGTVGNVVLTHNTIAGNEAGERGGGVFIQGATNIVDVYNNIVWENVAGSGGDMALYSTATFNGFNNDYLSIEGGWTAQGGNIHKDPLFVGGGNVHIQTGSPCRDAGIATAPNMPSTDIDGQPRVLGSEPDMGADEIGTRSISFRWPVFVILVIAVSFGTVTWRVRGRALLGRA